MSVTYTIQEFSEKTGIPKSTLRYYETIDLLHPVARRNNGYRTYSQEQIPLTKLIISLRIANIPIKDIQSFVKVDKKKQQKMINSWRTQLKQNIDMLRVGLQYLESGIEESEVYLLEKESEKIVWFEDEEKVGNFGKQFKKYRNILASKGIPVMNHYLKYISGENKILASIGFGVRKREDVNSLLGEMRVENMQKTLCIAMQIGRASCRERG